MHLAREASAGLKSTQLYAIRNARIHGKTFPGGIKFPEYHALEKVRSAKLKSLRELTPAERQLCGSCECSLRRALR